MREGIYKKYMKRPMDICLSLIAIVVLSPILLLIGALVGIKLGSPIIFRQKRIGYEEKIFTLYKFRTMTEGKDNDGKLLPDEKRLTKFGVFLRKFSLDELPELWNVLKGDMSIIGPRPLLIQYLPLYNEEQSRRHNIRPGLSGLAQISGRNSISWEEKFSMDIQYMSKVTFIGDWKIILRTLKKVFVPEGIHSETSATMEAFGGNKKKLIILGAGGHGKVVVDLAQRVGYQVIGFLDDSPTKKNVFGFEVLGDLNKMEEYCGEVEFVIALGSGKDRRELDQSNQVQWATLIHPTACIGMEVKIGEGTVVMANAVINSATTIGRHCIINSGSVVEHDNIIGNYTHISPNVTLGGNVEVGENCHLGIGSVVRNGLGVTGESVVGAGAVVVKNITIRGTYIGVPARCIREKN